MKSKTLSIIAAFVFLLSCAPKKEAVRGQPPELPLLPQEEAMMLPELPPEPDEVREVVLPPPGPEPVVIEEVEEEKLIILNFESTDIRTIIDTFSELLNINYILTPGISGTVTIQSYHKFPIRELHAVFQSVLEINGLTAVKEDSFYRIVTLDTAMQQPINVQKGKELQVKIDGSFVTQLVPLQYVGATEVANIFRNLMPRGTDLIVYEPANMLIITALPPTLLKFMKLVEALDVVETETESIRTFVYHVENGEAKTLEEILQSLYPEEKKPETAAAARTPRAVPTTRRGVTPPPQITMAAAEALPGEGEIGELTVTAYEDINALLIKASSKTYVALLEVLKKIDVPVKQVVIEVLIAEITLTDSTDFGVQWLLDTGAVVGAGFTTSSTPRTGFGPTETPLFQALISGTIDKTFLEGFITALSEESRVNVLASPQILALDNKEAQIEIGDEVPTATGLTQQPATGGGTTLVTSGQIQYRTVGTILTVTPHITEAGNVKMKLIVEQSTIGDSITVGSGTFPRFTSRKATTSAVVSSGRTLFLGGLISDEKNLTRRGIPGLSKIPLLGYLFGTTEDSVTKRELLVMVTPHVIGDQKEAAEITRQFQNRVHTIKKRLEELEEKGENYFLPMENGESAEEAMEVEQGESAE
ncbi:MAG: secretin N-terminal domain-containing protein [Nitrospirota bacterium]|jgi:type II secretory pathway component GspD/PulD (secretin)